MSATTNIAARGHKSSLMPSGSRLRWSVCGGLPHQSWRKFYENFQIASNFSHRNKIVWPRSRFSKNVTNTSADKDTQSTDFQILKLMVMGIPIVLSPFEKNFRISGKFISTADNSVVNLVNCDDRLQAGCD